MNGDIAHRSIRSSISRIVEASAPRMISSVTASTGVPARGTVLRLRPDRLGRRDALRVNRHRAALLPLHDAQLGADAAALVVVLHATVGEELGRAVLQVDLVRRLAEFFLVEGAGPL